MKTPKFSVGMATFDDFDRTHMTIQALRMMHGEFIEEIIVVDNHPKSKTSETLKNFCKSNNLVYESYEDVIGTAAPRNRIFQLAKSDYVVCLDSHVIVDLDGFNALAKHYIADPNCPDLIQGPMLYDLLNPQNASTHFNDEWGGGMLGRWSTDPRQEEYSWFEIMAQGLGIFACRKDCWLGFNPLFRGFGGEEWYIHEKFRKAGRKAICLSDFKWWHSFMQAKRIESGVPYPLSTKDKLRNYVIGFTELQDEKRLLEAKQHFKVSDEEWPEWLAVGRGEKEFVASHKPPVVASPVTVEACKDPKKRCGQAKVIPQANLSVEEWFKKSVTVKSEINEHVQKLSDLSRDQDVVVEFGTGNGISTAGLVYGKPKRLITVDLNEATQVHSMSQKIKEYGVDLSIVRGNTLEIDIPECDVLFIDTTHTGEHVFKELERHGRKVRRRIAFHDTELYGHRGADNKSPGLLGGILGFLKANREWQVILHESRQYGFTVISRVPEDFPKVDKFGLKDVLRFGKAQFKHKLNGGKYLPLEIVQERHDTCLMCPIRSGEQCSNCKCFLFQIPENMKVKAGQPGKIFYPHEICPLGKWFDQRDKGVDMTEEEIKSLMLTINGDK